MQRLIPRLFLLIAAALPAANALAAPPRAYDGGDEARGAWTSVRSSNFQIVGQAGEKDLRRVAVRLEEFRAAFTRLLSGGHFDSSVPTTIILFRGDRDFQPFKPLVLGRSAAFVSGYFQPGSEVNYITLALDASGGVSPTLLHEYTHLLVNNHFRAAPLWLKEGLSEFYSTAKISGDRRRVTLGARLPHRIRQMRGRALLPLPELFAVDQASPHYTDPDKRGLFYAQSWALVHYLLEGGGGERRVQLERFVGLLAEGSSAEESFRRAFGADFERLRAELSTYVLVGSYPESFETFDNPLDFDSRLQSRPLSKAEGLAQLGDLLLHADRGEEAEEHLRRALELDAGLAAARVSLGLLRLRQGRLDDAREQLRAAAAADPRNHLAHFFLADVLHRDGSAHGSENISVREFEQRTEEIRAGLRRAIELAPAFVEPLRLLASVEMERGDRPEEAATLLRRAVSLAPRRHDLTLLLAQAHLMKGEFGEARKLAAPVARAGMDARMREQAEALLGRVEAREQTAARLKTSEEEAARLEASADAADQPCDMPVRGGPQHKRLRFAGEQACGRLVEIECAEGFVVLRVETSDGRTLRFRAEDFASVRFVTYTRKVKTGRLSCGAREPSDPVLVTYRAARDDKNGLDGQALAVEFVPEEWKH